VPILGNVEDVRGTDSGVLVIGAGVSGLTTGIVLAEQGRDVTIWAKQPPQRTTSSIAGAIWGPHLVEASDRTARWASDTLRVLSELAGEDSTGVTIGEGIEAYRDPPGAPGGTITGETAAERPDKLASLPGFRPCRAAELPQGFTTGWRYRAPVLHMPTYLDYLRARFEDAGGQIKTVTVTSVRGAARDARAAGFGAVVNCTGAWAHDLVPDPSVVPFRGQVAVARNPGLSEFFIGLTGGGQPELVYMFPHGGTVILGGTEDAGDWDLQPQPAVAERILARCARVEPRLRGAEILAHRVGLRPFRPTVRLEAERASGPEAGGAGMPLLVHNYGHGGAGVTLSWGCAREAAACVGRV
jgi:D-amino-acid oxidase